MKTILAIVLLPFIVLAQNPSRDEIARWQHRAERVTIIRDNWGIPHIYAKSDPDAVFGLLYAQCEDDFKRIEMNYIEKLGRMAEVKGRSALAEDLYIRLIIDSSDAKRDYRNSPLWLRGLMNAYADGINYYLYTHPATKPFLLRRFEPWYPLLWTDGSIGAISTGTITPSEVGKFYLHETGSMGVLEEEEVKEHLTGSNGFALAPSKTESGHAILYINPHVTFYFRPEVHVVSEQGLDVYGAVTWGQFFVYQGFNEHCGWMHTSSAVDVSDMYAEKIIRKGAKLFYRYDKSEHPVVTKMITLHYTEGDTLKTRSVTAYYTGHGPVMAERDSQWISVRSYNRALKSLMQSWLRTKSTGFESFKKTMEMRANTSNNTVFADDKGNIAYWHGNFVPRRDSSLDWSNIMDGTTSATDWHGLHSLDEIVHIYDPSSGWIQNCNSTPFTASGPSSPQKKDYPVYMAPDGENFRGVNAARLLSKGNGFTLDRIIATAYDPTLTAFEDLVPAAIRAYGTLQPGDSLSDLLREPIAVLRDWDFQCGVNSVATTVAVTWGRYLMPVIQRLRVGGSTEDMVERTKRFASVASPEDLLLPLLKAVRDLEGRLGGWRTPWGEINRYQRLTGEIDEHFDDDKPSLPVGFASSLWGMLAAYNSRPFPGTKKMYGISGASFICAVEFGPKVRAKSLLTGGESGDPASTHFSDQALMYTTGKFKDVYFYKDDVMKHREEEYHPGKKRR